MTTRYDITLEQKETAVSFAKLVSKYFEGATIRAGYGIWQGQLERSVTVTVLGTPALAGQVRRFAQTCAHVYNQDAVLVETSEVRAELVDAIGNATDI